MWRIWYGIGWTKMICSSSSGKYYSDKSRQNTKDENITSNNEGSYRRNRTTLRNTIDWTIQRTIKHTRRTQLWRVRKWKRIKFMENFSSWREYWSKPFQIWTRILLDTNFEIDPWEVGMTVFITVGKKWACLFLCGKDRDSHGKRCSYLRRCNIRV